MSEKKETKKFSFKRIFISICIGYVLGLVVAYFFSGTYKDTGFEFSILFDTATLITAGGIGLLVFAYELSRMLSPSYNSSGYSTKTTDKFGNKTEQYFNSRLVTENELKTEKKFMYSTWKDLKKNNRDGIVIRAEMRNKDLLVNMYKPIHTLVIGTTGSGKSQGLVIPMIQILSETGSRPSMVITDPKGELYIKNTNKLLDNGYDVKVIDLRNPNKSSRWNPLDRPFDFYQRAHHLLREVKVYKNVPPNKVPNVKVIKGKTYYNEWYEFEGIAYPDKDTLDNDLKALKDTLISEAYEDISDIAATLCPEQGQDPSWSKGAQGFIKGVMLAMLEDSLYPELGLTKEKFNFYNINKICNLRDPDPDNTVASLQKYFKGRDKTSDCVDLGNAVVCNAPSTMKGFMGHVSGALQIFNDLGMSYLTSWTDIDFANFADKPSALFIIVPDERDSRYSLANIYITQLYKILIDRANKDKAKLELPNNVYFILDEFGNLPKIEKIKPFITAGRSRRLFLVLVVQDYTQLTAKYGENDAQTIKNNCNIQIFIGTKDIKTREEFSKNCGNRTLVQTNTSQSKNSDPKSGTSTSTSEQVVTAPLIPPEELDHLKEGEVIVNMFKEFSLRSTLTFAYKNPYYNLKPYIEDYIPGSFLDKEKIYYDIRERNDKVFVKPDDDDDDDDFENFMKKFKK